MYPQLQTIDLQAKIKEKNLMTFKFRCHYLKSIIQPVYKEYQKDLETLERGTELSTSQEATIEKAKAKGFVDLNKKEQSAFDALNKKSIDLSLLKQKVDSFNYSVSSKTLYDIVSEEILDIKPLCVSKSLIRGVEQEDESIEIVNRVLGLNLKKNTTRFTESFLSGEPDLLLSDSKLELLKDSVLDIKTCETKGSFDSKTAKSANDDYFWQLYAYKRLAKKSKCFIVYVLPSYSERVIKKIVMTHYNRKVSFEEADYYYNFFKTYGLEETIKKEPDLNTYKENNIRDLYRIFAQEYNNHNFDRLPENTRVKIFEIEGLDRVDDVLVDKILQKSRAEMVNIAKEILKPLDITQFKL
jgi:hypothetical protein